MGLELTETPVDKKENKTEIVKNTCLICGQSFTRKRVWLYKVEEKPVTLCKLCTDELIEQMIDNCQVEAYGENEDED